MRVEVSVDYWCPACKRKILRMVERVTKTRKSYCERAGKTVRMRIVG